MKQNIRFLALLLVPLFGIAGYVVLQDASPLEEQSLDDLDKKPIQNISLPPAPEIPAGARQEGKEKEKKVLVGSSEREEELVLQRLDCADYSCYKKHYTSLVQEAEMTVVFADIKSRSADTPLVKSFCHPLVHAIGRAAADKYSSVGEAFEKGDHFCSSGYFHGVTEGILRDIGPGALVQEIDSVCGGVTGKDVYSLFYYNCVHGLGHGTMFITENELFEALELCDYLTGSWERASCWGGVFMENIIADLEQEGYHSTEYVKSEDPLYPCNAVEEKYKQACYLNQTSYMAKVVNYDFAKIFDLCDQAEEAHKDICYQSLGRDASGLVLTDRVKAKAHCMLGKDFRQRSNCVIGAAKDMTWYHYSPVQAKKFCLSLKEELRQICVITVDDYYQTF